MVKFIITFRRTPSDLQKMSFIGDICECICDSIAFSFYCCCCRPLEEKPKEQAVKTSEEIEKEKDEALSKYKEKIEKASTKVSKEKIIAEERSAIINKIPDVATISLSYLSKMTLIPEKRVIEILLDDPDYQIEEPFVINKKMLTEEQVIKISSSIKAQITEEEDELSPIYKLCLECQGLYKQGSEFCPNCGARLKDN